MLHNPPTSASTISNQNRTRSAPLFASPVIGFYRVPMLIDAIASETVLEEAFAWLCRRRRNYPASADIWSFRRDWAVLKPRIKRSVRSGRYRFEVLDPVSLRDGSKIDLWSAQNALVLKALSISLGTVLPVSAKCTHIRGNGGAKAALRQVAAHVPSNDYVLRTDVKSYYASIDHRPLLDRLALHIRDQFVINLLSQYMLRTICDGGNFIDIERGISLGCPLSPLMATFFLHELDQQFDHSDVFYVRFMDDILILAPTRWKLRKAVARVNRVLSALRLTTHPDKTFIGHSAKGFDFLGYHFFDGALCAAKTTTRKMAEKAARLYEQKGHRSQPTPPILKSRAVSDTLERMVPRWSMRHRVTRLVSSSA